MVFKGFMESPHAATVVLSAAGAGRKSGASRGRTPTPAIPIPKLTYRVYAYIILGNAMANPRRRVCAGCGWAMTEDGDLWEICLWTIKADVRRSRYFEVV